MKAARALRRGSRQTGLSGRRPAAGGIVAALACGAAALLVPLVIALPARAQAVVQPVPAVGTSTLNAALARLGRDPRDLSALIDAGNAALAMGDVDAAVGFFARADQLSPENMRVKAGLAGALVRSENPYDAIALFAEADKAGALGPMLLSDRALAYDLVGDTATAQRYYRQSLAAASSDETLRRLALSQAIGGDRAGMEATLSPLLLRQDKAAWRTRAFALAILKRPDEAVAIANQTMPAELANGIAPYLRYMPRLTPAQQAAAANFGRFPRAAEIGRDDPRVALYAPPQRVATADGGLVPTGKPLGQGKARGDDRRRPAAIAIAQPPVAANPGVAAARLALPEPVPARQTVSAPTLALATTATTASPPSVTPAPPPAAAPVPAASPVAVQPTVFDLARIAPSAARPASPPPPAPSPAAAPSPAPAASASPPATTPASAPTPAAPPARVRPPSLADAFADLAVPSGPAALPPGAVDVRKLAARPAAAAAKPAPPPKPAHPSRIWAQVGTGRDLRALAFTWRSLAKDNPELFKGKDPSTADWGRTNRLLAGPFATEAAATAFVAKLKKADVDAFLWTSPAGQVVDDLTGR